ncbi:MAG: radical SAM family heme chaperone HemW [Bacteroidales bacterium]
MAGIYIHIPFCTRKCYYCAFYSTADTHLKKEYIQCIKKELLIRKNYIGTDFIETIYIGGGTPSLLQIEEIVSLFEGIARTFSLEHLRECTFEMNPESVTKTFLNDLHTHTPINRLSMGVQSFFEEDLCLLNRKHTAQEAFLAIENAKKCGFDNLSIDLIYGIPSLTQTHWQKNLNYFFNFDIPHLSAYALTVEENSILEKMIANGKYPKVDETHILQHYAILQEEIEKKGYQNYETSNYSKVGQYALHNTNYWKMKKYLGLGAAAHSYNGNSREWNVSDVEKYIVGTNQSYKEQLQNTSPQTGRNYFLQEKEELSVNDRLNEYIMTGLRTMWGVEKKILIKEFGKQMHDIFALKVQKFIHADLMFENENAWILKGDGKLRADGVARDLFFL